MTLVDQARSTLRSRRALTTLSLYDMQRCLSAAVIADEVLMELLDTCAHAKAQGGLIDPAMVELFITEHRKLYLNEAPHEPARTAA